MGDQSDTSTRNRPGKAERGADPPDRKDETDRR
jgi:hypothetical protein